MSEHERDDLELALKRAVELEAEATRAWEDAGRPLTRVTMRGTERRHHLLITVERARGAVERARKARGKQPPRPREPKPGEPPRILLRD